MISEILGVPYLILDIPQGSSGKPVDYVVAQMEEMIRHVERTTGKEYDDQRLVEAINNEWECQNLWRETMEFNKARPSPLDIRDNWELTGLITFRHKKESVEFYRELLDEVRQRVKDGISSRGVETLRLFHQGEFPFYALNYLPGIAERHGAVFIGGDTGGTSSMCHLDADWQVVPTPPGDVEAKVRQVRTRKDGLRYLAEQSVVNNFLFRFYVVSTRDKEFLFNAQQWHADAVVMHMDLGCRGYGIGHLETKITLQENGIPVFPYEASNSDPRSFSWAQIREQFEAFLQNQGLSPLADSQVTQSQLDEYQKKVGTLAGPGAVAGGM